MKLSKVTVLFCIKKEENEWKEGGKKERKNGCEWEFVGDLSTEPHHTL
jgi:hypothetical protein